MAKQRSVGDLVIHMKVDDAQVQPTIRKIKNEVKGLTNEWQANAREAKRSGDEISASKAKYEGLSEAVKKQRQLVDQLNTILKDTGARTGENAKQYDSLQSAAYSAANKLSRLNNELKESKKAYTEASNGSMKLREDIKSNEKATDAYVKRLEAEGKTHEATVAKLKGLRSEYNQMASLYEKQAAELDEIGKASGKTSKEYKEQATSLNELGAKMASTRTDIKGLSSEAGTTSVKMAKLKDNTAKLGEMGKSAFSQFKGAAIAAGAAVMTFGGAVVNGAKMASSLQQTYKENYNLMKLGASTAKEAAESGELVNKMQSDGVKYSIAYGKSQKTIAEGYQDLIKRGYNGKQAIGAMKTELQASVASGDDFNDVVKVSSQTLESFGLRLDKNGHQLTSAAAMTKNTKLAVNELAYAADVTATDFQSLGKGMEYVGATAHNSHFSLAETSAALGELSNNGLEADKAGTGLRKVIVSLASPTKNGAAALATLGLKMSDLKDKNGNLKDLSSLMGEIGSHAKKLSSSQQAVVYKALFGTTGMQAGQILANNADQLAGLTKQVEKAGNSGSYVQKLAQKNSATAQQNLARFKQALNALEIMMGNAFLPVMTKAANALTKLFAKKSTTDAIKKMAKEAAKVAEEILKIAKYASKHTNEIKIFAGAIAGIWAVNKAAKMISSLKVMLGLVGQISSKVNGVKIPTGAVDNITQVESKPILGGALQSMKSAGGMGGLSGAGKVMSGLSMAAVGVSAATDFYKAFTSKNMNTKFKSAGSGIGTAVGGGIGLFFGGPLGAALGASIGKTVGGWAGQASKSFVDGWNKKGMGKAKPKDFLGKLGYNARNVGDGINKWWDQVQKADAANQKKQAAQQKAANAKMKKDWDGFWSGLGNGVKKGWNSATTHVSDGVSSMGKFFGKGLTAISKFTVNTSNGFKSWGKKTEKSISSGLISAGTTISKWGSKTYKSYTKWLHGFENDMKKLGLVGAIGKQLNGVTGFFAGWVVKFALAAKKGFDKVAKNISSSFNNAKKSISTWGSNVSKWWSGFRKSFSKSWNAGWKSTGKSLSDSFNNSKKNISNWGTNVGKWWTSFYKNFGKNWNQGWSNAYKNLKNSFDSSKKNVGTWGSNIGSWWTSFHKNFSRNWNAGWSSTYKNLKSSFDSSSRNVHNWGSSVSRWWSSFSAPFVRSWRSIWGGVSRFFGSVWSGIKKDAKNGMQGVVNIINGAIRGINKVWHMFTGHNAISQIQHLASGGMVGKVRVVMVNDGMGENWKELFQTPSGQFGMFNERNKVTALPEGTRVYNGQETKQIMNAAGIQHYAKGGIIGSIESFVSGAGDKLDKVTKWLAHPVQNVSSMINNSIRGIAGATSTLTEFGEGVAHKMVSGVSAWFKKQLKKIEDTLSISNPGGSGVTRWTSYVKKALKANGLSTSSAMVSKVLRQIKTESGGNPHAVQGNIGDINNATGDLAKGLMQTISTTFNAYKFSGHGNIFNGYDNLLAALNYAKHAYGSNLSALGNGHGYATGGFVGLPAFANGGIVTRATKALIGEAGQEAVIPIDPNKASRSWALLGQVVNGINKGNNSAAAMGSNDVDLLAQKLDNIATLLTQLTFAITVNLDGDVLAQKQAPRIQAINDQKGRFNAQWKRNLK